MKIEIWSDFVCPFCYIGKRRLEEALTQFENRDEVKLEFKSFELDPNSPKDSKQSMQEVLASKYGMSIEKAKEMNAGIGEQAASVGLTFNFDNMKPTNTFDAHRLAHFAKKLGKDAQLTEKLLYAYFTESKNVADKDVLADIAETVGVTREEALTVLNDEQAYADDVRFDQKTAQQIGVRGVPFFVINQKYAISGAQTPETFLGAIQKAWTEANTAPVLEDVSGSNAEDTSCTDDGCAVPDDK
ncbi:DsbA family oxidoreductase [Lederbergia lenta]|uniref:Protein disulfide isomerase n=1 Tax=Lederbergia lenta TaxID=1467 RepID=A0A2X4VNI3_LEDLE|nr:DsbA family oxidoreductase [Lederbergia lenta]MCM3112544.1 DsbA family oxidoreductase [Lederbergia lenta]MEC2323580.1 DsbA family oxidoreductase [Lederbergia lenta]SQI52573.1 protein disulfide isomerase [Lederbergia lenta]